MVEIKTPAGLGSGVVFDTAGHIVTNAHVVGTATSFQVVLDGSMSPLPARLTGSYPPGDLAVIQVTGAAHLVPSHFADSSKLQVGDIVLAMGNPLGLASSVPDGIISAVGRAVSEPQEAGSPGATLPAVIQTSAAINPGNSGGALLNLADQVVGIPTLAATDQQLGGAAPGIGFAIPSNIVTDIAGQIIKTGHVTNSHRAALGVRVQTVTEPDGQPAGAGIATVTPGGPAAKAGLQPGEVITAVNGTATPDTETLTAVLAGLQPRSAGVAQRHQARRQHRHRPRDTGTTAWVLTVLQPARPGAVSEPPGPRSLGWTTRRRRNSCALGTDHVTGYPRDDFISNGRPTT